MGTNVSSFNIKSKSLLFAEIFGLLSIISTSGGSSILSVSLSSLSWCDDSRRVKRGCSDCTADFSIADNRLALKFPLLDTIDFALLQHTTSKRLVHLRSSLAGVIASAEPRFVPFVPPTRASQSEKTS